MTGHIPAIPLTLVGAREILVHFNLMGAQYPDETDPAEVTRQEVRCRLAAIQCNQVFVPRDTRFGELNGFDRARRLVEGRAFNDIADDLARLVSLF